MRYVVKIEKRDSDTTAVTFEYFQYAHWNPYNKHKEMLDYKLLTEFQSEAFKFHSRTAAEVIAATWGGRVIKLNRVVRLKSKVK